MKQFISCFSVRLLIYFFTLFFSHNIQAQRGWEIGGAIGVSHYFGDLNTTFDIKHPGLAASAMARFNFNERICVKMSANYGNIGADDKNSPNIVERQRNLNFRSTIIDGAAQMEFNFLPYNYYDKNSRFTPYMLAGINVFHFNPQGNLKGTWYDLAPLGTEGQFKGEEYYTTQLGLVYGFGLKFALNEEWSMNLELSARKLFTNYLDDVSNNYPNMNDLLKQRGAIAVALSDPSLPDVDGKKLGIQRRQRGSGSNADAYTFFTIGFLYYFGDLKCPTISGR